MIVQLSEYDFLKRALAAFPDQEAVVCGSHRFTYREFGARVNRWAQAMRLLGVRHGERVAILSQNCHRVLEAYFGAPLIGAISMPINFRLVPSDFEYILNHGGAKVLLVESGLTPLIDQIRAQLPGIEHFVSTGEPTDPIPDGWRDYESLLEAAPSEPAEPAPMIM